MQGWSKYWPAGQYFKSPNKQHREIVNHGITTQKFNENAKKNAKSNYVVWPAPSSKFLKMARGPESLATPDCYGFKQIGRMES